VRAKIAGGVLLLLVGIVLLLRFTGDETSKGEGADAKGNGKSGAGLAAGIEEPGSGAAKASARSGIREILPAVVKIEADEMSGSLAKGNVRLIFPNDVELWADKLQGSADHSAFTSEGRIMIWTEGRTKCLAVRGGPITWRLQGDLMKVESPLMKVEMKTFEEAQSEEQVRELQNLPTLIDGKGKWSTAEEVTPPE